MSKSRIWIIPVTVIVLIITAWAFRWGDGGYKDNRTYYVDRWLGQTWVKDRSNNAYAEYPLIDTATKNQAVQKIIASDPAKKKEIDELTSKMSEYDKLVSANAYYNSEYLSLSQKYREEWRSINRPNIQRWMFNIQTSPSEEAQIAQYANGKIPKEIQAGYYIYNDAQKMLQALYKQNTEIMNSYQATASQQLYDKAVKDRKVASIGSVAIGGASLLWLIYFFLFNKNRGQK